MMNIRNTFDRLRLQSKFILITTSAIIVLMGLVYVQGTRRGIRFMPMVLTMAGIFMIDLLAYLLWLVWLLRRDRRMASAARAASAAGASIAAGRNSPRRKPWRSSARGDQTRGQITPGMQ